MCVCVCVVIISWSLCLASNPLHWTCFWIEFSFGVERSWLYIYSKAAAAAEKEQCLQCSMTRDFDDAIIDFILDILRCHIMMHTDFLVTYFCYGAADASTTICHVDRGLRNDSEVKQTWGKKHTIEKRSSLFVGRQGYLPFLPKWMSLSHTITINKLNVYFNRIHFHTFWVRSPISDNSITFFSLSAVSLPLFHILLLLYLFRLIAVIACRES